LTAYTPIFRDASWLNKVSKSQSTRFEISTCNRPPGPGDHLRQPHPWLHIRASFFRRDWHFSLVFNHQGRNQVVALDRNHLMTTYAPAVEHAATACVTQPVSEADAAAFDAVEFGALSEMIGEDGVREMIEIFASETRRRLQRLEAGGQTCAALMREMHTLKGAAGTVAAPRLALLGRAFEHAAQRGVAPTPNDLKAIDTALEAFLDAARIWNESAGISG
jgi:HPt (histidine-containing phosphotransfer) domain-containing protein